MPEMAQIGYQKKILLQKSSDAVHSCPGRLGGSPSMEVFQKRALREVVSGHHGMGWGWT